MMDHFSDQSFPADTDAGALSAVADRRTLRDSLFLSATLTIDGKAHQVRVRNISSSGLMAEFSQPLPLETPVGLDIRGVGRVKGRVAWAVDGRIGIALDRPIDPRAARKPVGQPVSGPVKQKPIKPFF